MNLFSKIFRQFYSTEKKSSKAQLLDDFGEFPPVPLRCENMAGDFKILRMSGIGEIFNTLMFLKSFIKNPDFEAKMTMEYKMAIGSETILMIRTFNEELEKLHRAAKPIVIMLMLGVIGIKLTFQKIRSLGAGNKKNRTLGFFMPVFMDASSIHIRSGKFRKKSDASIISHEHIHLLQFRNPDHHSKQINIPGVLLSEKALIDPFKETNLYLLEKMEVEARLHECVISFYRANRYLPVTVPDFLGLLASSNQLGWIVKSVLDINRVSFNSDFENYHERDVAIVESLEFLLIYIKNKEILLRFVTEVMTVMYGNLFKYYGDHAASLEYLKHIKRPNLYDDLYKTLPV